MIYKYRLFQTPVKTAYCFRDFDCAMKNGFDRFDYVSVYAGEVDAPTIGKALEQVYMLHNRDNRPSGQCFRSVSMSDVVTINGIPYYCDDIGWSEVPADRWGRR